MKDVLRPILELTVVFPGLLLAYFPVRSYLKQSSAKLAVWEVPLLFGLCLGGGLFCYHFGLSTAFPLLLITIVTIFLYLKTLRLSLWKSGTIALAVCAVFACLNSLSRAVGTAITIRLQLPPDKPWFCFSACIFYNVICWLTAAAAYYPSTHSVRAMVEDDNFAQTWYVFWVLPMVFILLNLFITPHYQITLRIGRVLQVYIVMSIALLFLLFLFNTIFLLMANSLNRNARLQQENQFLSMQQQRYESLKTAIEEARQARHDMRHQLNQISALAEAGDLDNLKAYLAKTVSRIPDLDMNFCENRAADSVVGYYCALAKREGVPFCAKLDLPQVLPVDEIDLCLVLSNLLENAFEASLRTAPARRKIAITAYVQPSGFFWSKWKTHLTVKSTKKAGSSARPSERKTGSASSLSSILQKRPAVQAHLPIRMAFSLPRSCFVEKSSRQRPRTAPRSCTENVKSNAESAETCHIKSGNFIPQMATSMLKVASDIYKMPLYRMPTPLRTPQTSGHSSFRVSNLPLWSLKSPPSHGLKIIIFYLSQSKCTVSALFLHTGGKAVFFLALSAFCAS